MFKKILIISPHIDDGELGCGATISKFIREGYDIHYIAFSAAERSVKDEFPKDQLRIELKNASKVWGLKEVGERQGECVSRPMFWLKYLYLRQNSKYRLNL